MKRPIITNKETTAQSSYLSSFLDSIVYSFFPITYFSFSAYIYMHSSPTFSVQPNNFLSSLSTKSSYILVICIHSLPSSLLSNLSFAVPYLFSVSKICIFQTVVYRNIRSLQSVSKFSSFKFYVQKYSRRSKSLSISQKKKNQSWLYFINNSVISYSHINQVRSPYLPR